MAGCVFSVCFRASSEPSKHNFERENPRAASASSKTAFDSGNFSARSRPMPGYCDAWPGKRNASLPMRIYSTIPPESAARGNRGGSGKLLFDFFIEAGTAEFTGDANGVLDGVGIRAAVADD